MKVTDFCNVAGSFRKLAPRNDKGDTSIMYKLPKIKSTQRKFLKIWPGKFRLS